MVLRRLKGISLFAIAMAIVIFLGVTIFIKRPRDEVPSLSYAEIEVCKTEPEDQPISIHEPEKGDITCRREDFFKIDPRVIAFFNKANKDELVELPSIGEVMASRILEFRNKRPIRDAKDVLSIKGIGKKTLRKIEKALVIRLNHKGHEGILSNMEIDLNTATLEELIRLPGIGPTIAQRIIEYRNNRKFSSIDELLEVKGIGPAKLEKMKPHIKIQERGEVEDEEQD
ncbi:TPA: hypothetical protein DCX15_00110 [bacterium]|nr:hypothetical protein [bacterium]